MRNIILCVLGSVLLSGCGTAEKVGLWHDKSTDYLDAKTYPSMMVPSPFEKEEGPTLYAIPPAAQLSVEAPVDIRPPDLRK
jgi:uncharacterized lipoprotein